MENPENDPFLLPSDDSLTEAETYAVDQKAQEILRDLPGTRGSEFEQFYQNKLVFTIKLQFDEQMPQDSYIRLRTSADNMSTNMMDIVLFADGRVESGDNRATNYKKIHDMLDEVIQKEVKDPDEELVLSYFRDVVHKLMPSEESLDMPPSSKPPEQDLPPNERLDELRKAASETLVQVRVAARRFLLRWAPHEVKDINYGVDLNANERVHLKSTGYYGDEAIQWAITYLNTETGAHHYFSKLPDGQLDLCINHGEAELESDDILPVPSQIFMKLISRVAKKRKFQLQDALSPNSLN